MEILGMACWRDFNSVRAVRHVFPQTNILIDINDSLLTSGKLPGASNAPDGHLSDSTHEKFPPYRPTFRARLPARPGPRHRSGTKPGALRPARRFERPPGLL